MAKYTDAQLADRVRAVLYTNTTGDIDATELRDLLLDFVDSKLNSAASIGVPVHGTIDQANLADNSINIQHDLNTSFPIVFIKSHLPDGDIWSAINYSYGPVNANTVWLHFEEDLPVGSFVEYIIVKFA